MYNKLTRLQKLAADWGRPNDNGGSNYSDSELQYYLRNILKDYDDFIPTPVLRDAWKGARIAYKQPMYGGATSSSVQSEFDDLVRSAIDTRLIGRHAPAGFKSPTGTPYDTMWDASLSPEDAILRQVKLDQYQGSGTGDYYPPRD